MIPNSKVKQFTVITDVLGKQRTVAWEEDEQVLAITGVASYDDAVEALRRLGSGDPPPYSHSRASDAQEEARIAQQADFTREREAGIPAAAPPITKPTDQNTVGKVTTGNSATQEMQKTPTSPAGTTQTGDLAAFGRMNRLGEVVEELRKRGHATYESILAACKKMGDVGDVCPAVDALIALNSLEERLKVHLAGKGIEVPK